MRRLAPKAIVLAAGLAMFGAAPVRAADEGTASITAPARMEMTDDGPILATPAGMTLYTLRPDDNTPGKSQCASVPVKTYQDAQGGLGEVPLIGADIQKSCVQKWPPLLADEHAQPGGDFSLINRPEGSKQWTYRGHPLYLSIRDHAAGERNGVSGGAFGVGRGFRLATVPLDLPGGLKLMRREEGLVLATANDRPVYTSRGLRLSKINAGSDDELFQPILAPAMAKVSGDWSIVDAGVGRHQYAFKGQPLFAAPDSLTDWEIAAGRGWEPVVFRKGPGTPSEIEKRMTLIGEVYTDRAGHTLYTFNCNTPAGGPGGNGVRCDDPGDAAGYWVALCGDAKECARRWHPYVASADARPKGEFSVIDVAYPMFTTNPGITYPPEAPRVKAWAYRGQPLYTYYEDKEPGEIWGHLVKWIGGSSFTALQVPGRTILE